MQDVQIATPPGFQPPKVSLPDVSSVSAAMPARKIALLRVLGPGHVWALGVGIVLVGEFMGWNFAVGKGGPVAALTACWLAGILYTCVAMIDSEITSTVAAAGGQYAQAKHIIGPLAAFNVGLYLVMAYTMLEVSNAIVTGDLIEAFMANLGVAGTVDKRAFMVLTIVALAFLNYRGVLASLTMNLLITAAAFLAIVVLFVATQPWAPGAVLQHDALLVGLPYGNLGILAAMHFGLWFYLGIEGTTQAAEEVRSPARALPLGTMTGMMTLLIAATATWYVCSGLMPWEYLGQAVTPLYDAGRLTGNRWLEVFLFFGTLFATVASANGCINDASRAWFAMGRDRYMPAWFGAVHPAYHTPLPVDRLLRAGGDHVRGLDAARPDHHLLDPIRAARLHADGALPSCCSGGNGLWAPFREATSIRSIRCRVCCFCFCAASPTSRCFSATGRSSLR